jgi:hypothetical protein
MAVAGNSVSGMRSGTDTGGHGDAEDATKRPPIQRTPTIEQDSAWLYCSNINTNL